MDIIFGLFRLSHFLFCKLAFERRGNKKHCQLGVEGRDRPTCNTSAVFVSVCVLVCMCVCTVCVFVCIDRMPRGGVMYVCSATIQPAQRKLQHSVMFRNSPLPKHSHSVVCVCVCVCVRIRVCVYVYVCVCTVWHN